MGKWHYAHENGCSTYLLFKSAPLMASLMRFWVAKLDIIDRKQENPLFCFRAILILNDKSINKSYHFKNVIYTEVMSDCILKRCQVFSQVWIPTNIQFLSSTLLISV